MKSLQDYINYSEALKILLRTVGVGSLTQLVLMIAAAMLNGAGVWYVGPGQAAVVLICSTLASAITGIATTVKYINQGTPLDHASPSQTPAKQK